MQTNWLMGVLGVLVMLVLTAEAIAEVKLPSVIGSDMVLQRDMPLPIWGWAAAGEEVTVSLTDGTGKILQTLKAKPAADGKWTVTLKPIKTGPVYSLTVKGSNEIKLTNILAGEVWLCSGQSNMHWTFAPSHGVVDNQKEVAAAKYPEIRFFDLPKQNADQPLADAPGRWLTCTPENLLVGGDNGASALAYFFGRELHTKLKVPVALINASLGGTRIESWTVGGTLYNAMINPVVPFAIRGAIWYQGEANCSTNDGMKYAGMTKDLLAGWRKAWGEGDFPFYFVQLGPWIYSQSGGQSADALPEFWEAQTACLAIPNTGMVVIADTVTDVKDIHPKNKQDVGKRLALWALAKTYGQKNIVCSGPTYKSMKVEGDKIVLTFDNVGGALASRDGKPLSWFTIAGADHKFVPAQARIDAKTVVVWSKDVPKPMAVRLGWSEIAQPNLMNKEGLPACPFRTDAPATPEKKQ